MPWISNVEITYTKAQFSLTENIIYRKTTITTGLGEIRKIMKQVKEEGLSEMLERLEADDRLRLLKVYMEKDMPTLEEEAREVISYRLRKEGINVTLSSPVLPGMEIAIYGSTDDVSVVGEATTRLGIRLLQELEEKVKLLATKQPEHLRRKLIKVIYTMRATDDVVEKAKESNIWVLTATTDLTPMKIMEL